MKDSSIRFRISETEKARIEGFAVKTETSVSAILRRAAIEVLRGEIPGTRQRRVCVDVRHAANALLGVMDSKPIDIGNLRESVNKLRIAARELIECR